MFWCVEKQEKKYIEDIKTDFSQMVFLWGHFGPHKCSK